MRKRKYMALDKDSREFIMERMREQGEMTIEEVMEMIRHHYVPDYEALKEREIRQIATRMFRSLRDESGVRTCFAVKSKGIYVNVDVSTQLENIRAVDEMLAHQIAGLELSRNKARRRRAELEGQISMDIA